MKLLQLTHRLPWPPIDGGKKGTLGFVQGYGNHPGVSEHSLFSMCPTEEGAWAKQWNPGRTDLHVELIDAHNRVFPFLANTFFSGLPFNMEKYRRPSFAANLRTHLTHWKPDVVHFDSLHTAAYAQLVKDLVPGALRVLRCHNAEHVILERLAENESHPLKRLLIKVQARRLKRYEGQRLSDFDLVLPITDVDSQRFERINPAVASRLVVVPAGADLPDALPTAPPLRSGEPVRLLHIAAMDWIPNQAGLRWLLEDVLPLLDASGVKYQLDVVGKEMPAEFLAISRPSVKVHGFVEDLKSVLSTAHIAVVPLQVGGGMRVKILDYWSQGIPVVSTRVGAEGLHDAEAPVVALADSAQEFSSAIMRLANHDSDRDKLRRAAFRKVQGGYGWPQLIDGLVKRYTRCLADRPH